MCRPTAIEPMNNPSCDEKIGDAVDGGISAFFRKLGAFVGGRPRVTILLAILLTVACGGGFASWTTESRGDELWVPQDTRADAEEATFLKHFESGVRFNQVIFQSNESGGNVLTKDQLVSAMQLHNEIEVGQVTIEGEGTFGFVDLCIFSFGSCATAIPSSERTVCGCVINSILGQWNYDLSTLEEDEDWLTTLQGYGSQDDLNSVLGNPVYEDDGSLVSAEAFTVNYLLEDRAFVENGADVDPINGGWEEAVFLNVTLAANEDFPELKIDYFAGRSFEDVFGGAITGDLVLVQVSYVLVFLFLGAAMGRIRCGTGSRWTMALAGVLLVGLSLGASFGVSSLAGLFYGPVHSLLPFILLGIGVDDAFVIVNAFDRERKQPRAKESNADITKRCTDALARAGASITVTSATDLVAFAISSSSALPALASFCAYAAIGIFFLWLFASTFFTATLVLDERRQRDNRRECLCCLTRQREIEEDADGFKEGFISRVFREYHAPAILSKHGKVFVFLGFGGLLAFGVLGALNLAVEDSGRSFIPADSYVQDWLDAGDEYFASRGKEVSFLFEGGTEIFAARNELAVLSERVTGLSEEAPYIAEPTSEDIFRNVMGGFKSYVEISGLTSFAGVALGDDGWPESEEDFVTAMTSFASFTGPGAQYAQDVSVNGTTIGAIRVKAEYIRLVKDQRGRQIEDASKLIRAMDETRALAESWDDLPPVTVYGGEDFLTIEGFKIIQRELFQNVGLAILAVAVIVFFTIGSFVTSLLITINVAFAIIEILGFMYSAGVVIDSVSVINMVLAVGLTVDYSAHVGHCFMAKGGTDRNQRATEALADIGAAVLSGATSTFLAVVVLLFSKSYVFKVLAIMFALTVGLGTLHGLVLLPVMLSVFGPKPFSSAEAPSTEIAKKAVVEASESSFLNGEQINLDMPPSAMKTWKQERELMKKRTQDTSFVIGEHVNLDMTPKEFAEKRNEDLHKQKEETQRDDVSVGSELYA